jgi:hypothetical protein
MVEYFNLMKMAHIRAKKMKVGTYSERYTQALAEVQAERGFQKDQKPKFCS